ncbi:MAG: TetR/AcrR family transcriptional regulator [Desulfopila sp.]
MKAVDKHTRIITAATKVFAKKGFFTARISDIAKEARVADGTIYLYFNNKFDILISVFEEEIGKLVVQAKKALEKETDPLRMLEIFALRHLGAMKKNKNLAEVIQVELRQTNKTIRDYRNSTFTEYLDIVADIIRSGQRQQVFHQDINPELAKRIFFGSLDEVSRVWNISLETHYTVEDITNQILRIFFDGLKNEPTS